MADNKSKTDKRDSSKVAGLQGYEVDYLAEKLGITKAQAKKAIDAVPSRSRKSIEAYALEHYGKTK